MTRRRKKKNKNRPRPKRPTETKASETVTIGWSLTVVTTLVCDLGTIAARLYFRLQPEAVRVGALSELLLFAAVTIGIISLGLLAVVIKVRRESPPRGFVVFAILIAAAPLVAIVARLAR